jgi:hypothetical protein
MRLVGCGMRAVGMLLRGRKLRSLRGLAMVWGWLWVWRVCIYRFRLHSRDLVLLLGVGVLDLRLFGGGLMTGFG